MATDYDVECSPPSLSTCPCCNGLSVSLTRFVYRNGDPAAVYYAAYANNHPDNEVSMLVSLGPWHEGSGRAQRVAFHCVIRDGRESYEVMLQDVAASAWRDVELTGRGLSRDEALAHPWKAAAFEVLDAGFAQDPSLQGFLQRVRCGDAATPLERSYRAPDALAQCRDDPRLRLSRALASFDGTRFFARGLLPIPVEHYGHWHVGVWVELPDKGTFTRIDAAWDDAHAYAQLRFRGELANDLRGDLGLDIPARAPLSFHVANPSNAPILDAASVERLRSRLCAPWAKAAFETYAVSRGFL